MISRAGSGPELRLPPGPVVKVCGLTRAEDACVAAEAGAWALGFVFAPSLRRVTAIQAHQVLREMERTLGWGPTARIESAARPLAVGVFGDEPAEEIARVVRSAGLDAVQLHGTRGAEPEEVRLALAECEQTVGPGATEADMPARLLIIRAVAVALGEEDPASLRTRVLAAAGSADLVLLDTAAMGRFGGTGVAFPWELARGFADAGVGGGDEARATTGCRILVAGGIGPSNVQEALQRSAAWGVDVSSGVESSPGVKDAGLMRDLMEKANGFRRAAYGKEADGQEEGLTR
jgi:phosphoribosylanthranilate isomerase